MSLDVDKVVEEFKNYELDPAKIETSKIFTELMAIKHGMSLATTAECRHANDLLLKLFQVIGFKAAKSHYYERVLADTLKGKKMAIRLAIDKDKAKDMTKEDVVDYVETNEEVLKLSTSLTVASASRFFWQHMVEMLHEGAKRVDSASASLGVETKFRGNNG